MDTCTTGNFIGIIASGLVIDDVEVAPARTAEFPNDSMVVCPAPIFGVGTLSPCRL